VSRGVSAPPAPVRTLVLWLPHLPLTAAGARPDEPAVVVHANRVVAASPAARDRQVVVGLRRREAQARCPDLAVLEHDQSRDARCFEPVVRSLERFTPRIEILEPGWCSFPTRGPSRYFGGDEDLALDVLDVADAALGSALWSSGSPDPRVAGRVGVADGPFTAELAARDTAARPDPAARARVVPAGDGPAFLAPLPVTVLDHRGRRLVDRESLVDLLWRLGLRTLGAVAEVPATDLSARFGPDGLVAHRLASGHDPQPPDTRPPPPEWSVAAELDPPAERVETATFWAKALADEMHERLQGEGLAATRVLIEAETEHGESLARSWRHEGALQAGDLAARVRWQLDGWLHSTARPTGPITLLRLVPTEVVAAHGRQLGFWGGESQAAARAARALARLQGLVGPEGVAVPELRGGRGPADQLGRVPVGALDMSAEHRPVQSPERVAAPWPGRLPAPSPVVVHPVPPAVEVVGADGGLVEVTGRCELTAAPVRLRLTAGTRERVVEHDITGWSGPWPCDERWWDPPAHRRRARLQVVVDDGMAYLVTREHGAWVLEATYD
jgi:protein ImuB